ncbi:MAG: response regulator [Verrucomicrobia bacterium]|nr:response regulator [Cytophagales bacterium]
MKNHLQRRQMEVKYALNLKQGLELAKSFNPNVIFLDNNLPDGTGINEIRKIKEKYKQTKVIVISAMSHLKEKALYEGADIFLVKPINFKAVVASL